MKSVVVEASTVAKAIETAWHKAEKPEEFFVRVLQEHQSGFLGFGSQKAKIVLFFKNSQKSDSLFPVVLKQKEYASLFGNNDLKTPQEVNFVDADLNKNITVANQHKKKNQHQNGFQKQKKHQRQNEQKQMIENQKSVDKHIHANQPLKNKVLNQVQLIHQKEQHPLVREKQKEKSVSLQKNPAHVSHVDQPKPVSGKSLVHNQNLDKQTVQKVAIDKENFDKSLKKDDLVKDIAQTLKKVQSQKIVAHVSRQVSEKIEHAAIKKGDILDVVIDTKPFDIQNKTVENLHQPVTLKKSDTTGRFKRRPLIIDDQSVSGIKPLVIKSEKQVEDISEYTDKKIDEV